MLNQSKHIIGLVSSLDPVGGLERMFLRYMDAFEQHLGYRVHIFSHVEPTGPCGRPFTSLRPEDKGRGMQILRLRQKLADLPTQGILFPFGHNSNILAVMANAALGNRYPVVLNERCAFTEHRWSYKGIKGLAVPIIAKQSYLRATHLVCNSKSSCEILKQVLGAKCPPVSCVYNPIDSRRIQEDFPPLSRKAFQDVQGPVIVAHGRLDTRQKGWDTLLAAFVHVRLKFPNARLTIIGDGPDRKSLALTTRQLGIERDVNFPGFTKNPFPAVVQGDVYAFPSRFEGFPNALLEAMALGMPIVAADCPTGPRELISPSENGDLVPVGDAAALSQAIIRQLSDGALREKYANNARRTAKQFTIEESLKVYSGIFESIYPSGNKRHV